MNLMSARFGKPGPAKFSIPRSVQSMRSCRIFLLVCTSRAIDASSTMRARTKLRQRHITPLAVCCVIILITLAVPALALDANQLANDYIRTDFTVEDGLPDNVVNAVLQTQNGLLWVGTQSGLASFDGREFNPIDLQTLGSPSQGAVHALLESATGDLWVGTHAGVVLIPKPALDQFDPALLTFFHLGSGPSDEVEALLQARDGAVWAGTSHGLYRQVSGKFVEVIPTITISRITQALNGHLLLVTSQGFIEWDGHKIIPHPDLAVSLGVSENEIFNVFQDRNGTMWYCTNKGIVRQGSKPLPPLQPLGVAKTAAYRNYVDPQGSMWVASGVGLYRVNGDQMETPAPNLHARSFFAGRDGELWIGTNGIGLIHLKHRVVHMFTTADGIPNDIVMAVLASHDGKLWAGHNCGFSVFDGKQFKTYNEKDGLLNTCIWSLAEDNNHDLWIGTYGGGLFRFRDNHFVQYSVEQGLVSKVVLQIAVAHDGSLWMATPDGISHMQSGHFRNYTIADGLSSNQALSVFQDRSGTIWAATQGGIDRLAGEKFVPFRSEQTREGPFSIGLLQDSLGDLYTADSPKGMSLIENRQLIPVNDDLKVLNMVESAQHDLWFSGNNGVIRVRLNNLKRSVTDHDLPLDYELFDRADGLNSVQCSVGSPSLAITPDNKLWVATVKGLAMLDLAYLTSATRKPKVFVGAVTIGKNKELAGGKAILPPGTHHVELHLEAVDLASPEKIRLQYRLDGVDASWLDADASRTAVYTNIPTGSHAFRVRASGSDGVWDRTGIVYDITQQPYFYQTTWFRIVAAVTLLLLVSAAYLMRVQQIVRQSRILLEERLEERERIARELHDTLLQGVLSASLQLDLAEDQLPEDSPTKPLVRRVLQMMRQVVEEGRNALRGLRTHEAEGGDLAIAFSRIGLEFAIEDKLEYRVITQGTTRPLRLQIRDEVYRIGREAIANAFMHAGAKSVEVEIEYAGKHLRLLVRDDGSGIDPHVLDAGREGHWGLAGMRERSEGIGASLKLRSRVDAGTEVELTIPAAIAFESGPGGPISRWLPWLNRERFEAPAKTKEKRG